MGQLLEAIADPANLASAWTSVRANRGAAGVDGQSIASFEAAPRASARGTSTPTALRRAIRPAACAAGRDPKA